MKYIEKHIHSLIPVSAVIVLFITFLCGGSVFADTLDTIYMRAKITYEYEDETVEITDDDITFSDGWEKNEDDGWYYYETSVASGDTVRFIEGVQIPSDWSNESSGKEFSIVITVQIADVVSGDEDEWSENTEIIYEETWDLFLDRYDLDESQWVLREDLSVVINEYELDEDGELTEYENDKLIVPGQFIDKIVEFTVYGGTGVLTDIVLSDPVKYVYQNGISVDGMVLEGGSIVQYVIAATNTAPNTREITITDDVDYRLYVTTIEDDGEISDRYSNGNGGTIEWTVTAEAGETVYVSFWAQLPECDSLFSLSIANTAVMSLAGQSAKTNTVVVSVGTASPLQQIQSWGTKIIDSAGTTYQIARSTGDFSNIALYAAVLMFGSFVLAVMFIAVYRRRKKKNIIGG